MSSALLLTLLTASRPVLPGKAFFSLDVGDGLQVEASLGPCKAKHTTVKLSLLEGRRVLQRLTLEDASLPCQVKRFPEETARFGKDTEVLTDAGEDEGEGFTLEIGALSLGDGRRAVVTLLKQGLESIGFDHALFAVRGRRLQRVWREAHHGFENGTWELGFHVEPADTSGAEHLELALMEQQSGAPVTHLRVGVDPKKGSAVVEPLPGYVVLLGTFADADAANAGLDALRECGGPLYVGSTEAVVELPGKYVVAVPTMTRAEADQALVDAKKCAKGAAVHELHPR